MLEALGLQRSVTPPPVRQHDDGTAELDGLVAVFVKD
jgi:hypothetical protein